MSIEKSAVVSTTTILALAFFLCLPALSNAQSLAGLGALSGTVHDPSGAVVSGAAVEISNPSIGIDRKLKATSDGYFFASSLPPASGYKLTVQAEGFATFDTAGIDVHVGETVSIPVNLSITASQSVMVSNEAPLLDTSKTEVSALVDQNQIMNLPINGRRVDQFALLTPGVVQDGTNGDISFHGVPGGNSFLQDGVDITQQWFVANAGGGGGSPAILSNISQDAVAEFRTETLGYSAEFGRSAGGVLNTLTKSGTNNIHGSAFEFFRNRTLNAIDLFSKLNGQPFNAPEYRHQFGGSVGGPIIHDKLFFFANYEGTKRNFPLVSSIVNTSLLDSNTHLFLPGVCNASAAQCSAAQTYFNRFFQKVDRTLSQNIAFLKLDWRPTDRSSYTANFNLVNYSSPHGLVGAVAPTDGSGVGTNGNISTHIRNARLSNTYLVSGTMVNELRLGWNADRRFQGLATDLVPPNGLLSALTVAGQGSLGVSANQLSNIQPTEDRFVLGDNFSQTKGKHQLKYGLDLAYLKSVENAVFNGPGNYTYATVTAFAQDLTPSAGDPGIAGKHWTTFAQALGHPLTRITIRDYDFFAQDLFQVTPALALNLGLRYEFGTYTQPPLNPDYPATGTINQPKNNFAPRVGFAYAANHNTTVVRGSYGIFYDRLPGAAITRLQQLGGVVRKSFSLSSSNAPQFAAGPTFPNRLTSLSQIATLGILVNAGFAKPGLSTPYVQTVNFGVDQAIKKSMSVNISYNMSRGVKFLQRSDLNLGPLVCCDTFNVLSSSGAVTGSYSTPVYLAARRVDPRYIRVLQIDNGGRLWYDGLSVEFRQRESNWLQTTLAYTWSHASDLAQGGATVNYYFTDQGETYFSGASIINGKNGYAYEKGNALEDQRHRGVVSAILTPPRKSFSSSLVDTVVNGWQLSSIFTGASPQYSDSYLTVSSADGRLAFPTPTLSGVGSENSGGNRVPFSRIANLPLGTTVQADGRLTKAFRLPKEQQIELSFEAINALNHIRFTSVNQTVYRSTFNAGSAGTTSTGITGTGNITQQSVFGTGSASAGFPDGTNARRAQVSIRYSF